MAIVVFGIPVFFATGDGEGFATTGGDALIIDGKLGIGRETGASVGVDVGTGVWVGVGANVAVKLGVIAGVGVIFGAARRRERGPGLIGRTGSKYWVWLSSIRVVLFG